MSTRVPTKGVNGEYIVLFICSGHSSPFMHDISTSGLIWLFPFNFESKEHAAPNLWHPLKEYKHFTLGYGESSFNFNQRKKMPGSQGYYLSRWIQIICSSMSNKGSYQGCKWIPCLIWLFWPFQLFHAWYIHEWVDLTLNQSILTTKDAWLLICGIF